MHPFAEIAETYDWTEQSAADIPFYVDLAREARGPILELGAGTGRITVPVATVGEQVTAIDVSEAMLTRAKAKRPSRFIDFQIGDFRSLSLNAMFGLILAPGRVFEHALSDAERVAVFEGCARHLTRHGTLALHVWGPPCDDDPAPPERTKLISPSEEHGSLLFSWREERDFTRELRRHYFRIQETDRKKRVWVHAPIEVRWYTADALDALGRVTGLDIRGRFGNFHGATFQPGALNMVWVYQKR